MSLDILEPRKSLLVSVALNRTQMTCIHERCKHFYWCLSTLQTVQWHPPPGDVEAFAHPTRHPQDSAPQQLRGTQTSYKTLEDPSILSYLVLVGTSRAVARNETTCKNQSRKILDKLLHHRVKVEGET